KCAKAGFAAFQKTATRETFGRASCSSSSLFPVSSAVKLDSPVIFPPGRERLATSPLPTGSLTLEKTTGIVLLAPLAARAAGVEPVTITSTFRRTSSAARSGRRSSSRSAHRYSIMRFLPSTYPSSRSPWRNASYDDDVLGDAAPRYPIRGTFFGC